MNPFIPGMPYSSPIPQMYESGALQRSIPQSNWMNYLGLGASAMAPVAAALIGRQQRNPSPSAMPPVSVGNRPNIQLDPGMYPQQQRIPSFLARMLMGR